MFATLKYVEGARPGVKRPAASKLPLEQSTESKIKKQRLYEKKRNRSYLTKWEDEFPWLVYEARASVSSASVDDQEPLEADESSISDSVTVSSGKPKGKPKESVLGGLLCYGTCHE